ncbi:MAG TPA: hypothetical protein VKE41_05845 [Roseiflexaceae bacterium]|nr:hypothetical protein [Roseiflexaceae bacterium]
MLLIALLVLALIVPGRALAHGGHTGPMQTFTQEFGPYEVAITVEIPPSVPSPLYLDIAPQQDMEGVTMRFRVAPRGQPFDGAPIAEVRGNAGQQGVYLTQLDVDRFGDWDLEATISGPKGAGSARIPFTIASQPLPTGSIGLFAGLGGLVVLMIASITLTAIAQRRGRLTPGWANWLIGQGMFACLIVAAIFGIQQFNTAIQSAQASADPTLSALGLGRPHANLALHTSPDLPQAGQPLTLTLDLSDGSTGLPVEDLVPHHEALMHLVVISADGRFYAHVHPPRVAPGRYAIAITPDRPGRYTAYAEIQRQDSGTQVISRDFELAGAAVAAAQPTPGLGEREVAGMQVNVASSLAPLRAGKQATISFSFSQAGAPVNDLQPWLGMGGHLIARSADGATFAHVHAIGPMAPSGVLASGVAYGPDIRFVYTFPQPGRYQIWGQFRHQQQIVTVPLEVNVE